MDGVGHLADQANTLVELIAAVDSANATEGALEEVRDQLFLMQETLVSMGVAAAGGSILEWNREIGTTFVDEGPSGQ